MSREQFNVSDKEEPIEVPIKEEPIKEKPEELPSHSLSETLEDTIEHEVRGMNEKVEVIEFKDASSETAKTLVPQIGSDADWLAQGKMDFRRFTNINQHDPLWISYFWNKRKEQGGNWLKKFITEYANYRYSVNAHNKITVVEMQRAVQGGSEDKPVEDKRNFIQRHITQRGKEPKAKLYDVGD